MVYLGDLLDLDLLARMVSERFVREQIHPTLPLRILNYTEKAAYDGVWNEVTLQSRGLIYVASTLEVVARPFPKFFNHGQLGSPLLDLSTPAVVTDKMDGSLGILYPTGGYWAGQDWAIATRGSFTSDQALHATETLARYLKQGWYPASYDWTFLFEIIYPENRIVVDYEDTDDLVLLDVLEIATGKPIKAQTNAWPWSRAETHPYRTLGDALTAEPRPNREGLVVWFPETNERVKIKQDDYMALHRILTGTNARHVWEVAAVQTLRHLIREPKHWGSFLGIDPARAEEVLALGDDWLAGVPDEFYDWVHGVYAVAVADADQGYEFGSKLAETARGIDDRKRRYEWTLGWAHELTTEVMRLAAAVTPEQVAEAENGLRLRCWREAAPEPTAPWERTEDVA